MMDSFKFRQCVCMYMLVWIDEYMYKLYIYIIWMLYIHRDDHRFYRAHAAGDEELENQHGLEIKSLLGGKSDE